ncbi:hypothetical protein ACVD2R_11640 [Escherichia coli]|uniref:hypothetical protein n=1 Tax=Escherichia coli TaxID=562 RepID=UPI003EE5A2A3
MGLSGALSWWCKPDLHADGFAGCSDGAGKLKRDLASGKKSPVPRGLRGGYTWLTTAVSSETNLRHDNLRSGEKGRVNKS